MHDAKQGAEAPAEDSPAAARARKKWVSHGLSNAIVYGGLHYGARWLPMSVLNGINLVGNSLAIALLRETQRGIRENFRIALGAEPRGAARLARALFFEYGRHTIDVWRLRSEAFVPRITTFAGGRAGLSRPAGAGDGASSSSRGTSETGRWGP